MLQIIRTYKNLIFALILFLLSTSAHAGQDKTLGTLVVTYSTGDEALRLNRVKFWLISNQGSYRLFPNNNAFVDDPITKKRMVLIENLPEGEYTIKFVYPNSDGLFEKVEPKVVTLNSAGVVKIDQDIRMKADDIEMLAALDTYEIAYESPYQKEALPLREVRFYKRPQILNPESTGYLNIRSNLPGAQWGISKDGAKVVSGEGSVKDLGLLVGSGYKITVEEIPNYEVKVSVQTQFSIVPGQTFTIEITYKRILAHVRIMASMPSSDQLGITIEGSGLKEPIKTTQISRGNRIEWKSPDLPLGTYVVTIKTPSFYEEIPPAKIILKQGQNVILKPKMQGVNKIIVTTNTQEAIYTLRQDNGPVVMHGKGASFQFEKLFPGAYTLTFSTTDINLEPPRPRHVTLTKFKPEEELVNVEYLQATEVKQKEDILPVIVKQKVRSIDDLYLDLLSVPRGPSILGDPSKQDNENTLPAFDVELSAFEISKYEVTNGQFASFLNAALEEKIIFLSKDQEGLVLDSKNRPLFYAMEHAKDSQITITKEEKNPFDSLPGFEDYPVIFVSWYGANAFCEYYTLRLPTESEWERAAAVTSDTPLKKWIFGFSKDTIDRTFANYKTSMGAPFSKKVLTTPVGFYNGVNTLPLTPEDLSPKRTENALSPIGAYDMSGNVFEWVQDWYSENLPQAPLMKDYKGPRTGTLKVAKGGCYDSLADGVRSFERMALAPSHLDAYTGFRVARDTQK